MDNQTIPSTPESKPKKKSHWLWWLVGIFVLMVVAVAVIYFMYYKPILDSDGTPSTDTTNGTKQTDQVTKYDLYFVQQVLQSDQKVSHELYKADPLAPSNPTLLASGVEAYNWAISKQGSFAYVDQAGDIKIKNGGQEYTIDLEGSDSMPFYYKFLLFSSDGQTLYYSTGKHINGNKLVSDINAYNLTTQANLTLLKREQESRFMVPVGMIKFNGQDNILIRSYYAETEGPVFLADFERIHPATKAVAPITFPADAFDFDISADGTKFVLATVDKLDPVKVSALKIMDITSGALEVLLTNSESKLYTSPEWLDTKNIVFVEGSGTQALEGPTTPQFEKYRALNLKIEDSALTEILGTRPNQMLILDAGGETFALANYPTDSETKFAVVNVATKKETTTKGGSVAPIDYRFVNYYPSL